MGNTTNLSIRLDRELKAEADLLFGDMGMSLTTAITVFVRQAVRQKKIPFEISVTNPEKEADMQAAREALERIRQNAILNGTGKMTMKEINAEITAARKERKERRTST